MATLRKRGSRWHVQVRRKGFPSVSRSFQSKSNAKAWARNTEASIDRYDLPRNFRCLDTLTVGDIIERYRDTVTIKKRGRRNEIIILNALIRQRFARLSLAETTPDVFSAYRDARLQVVKPTTIRRELSLLKHAFGLAKREWGIPLKDNPLDGIRRPPPDQPRQRRLKDGELARLLEGCQRGRTLLLRPLVQLAVETGMRRGELLNIHWEDINFEKRTLRIPITKNGHARTIPLTLTAISVLRDLPQNGDGRAIPTTGNAIRLAWCRLTRRVGIDDLHFHDLRHEAISRFFEMGLSVPEVALISGHRDYRMLFRYTHLRAEDVVKKLN
ncbi:MAG: site-specific integrase [Rhodospirillales bacterium]|nr:site-specific integrase [Rhodospirillales bacterium]MDP7650570.1 site-specific integrase [Rhodospirillales bacterium]